MIFDPFRVTSTNTLLLRNTSNHVLHPLFDACIVKRARSNVVGRRFKVTRKGRTKRYLGKEPMREMAYWSFLRRVVFLPFRAPWIHDLTRQQHVWVHVFPGSPFHPCSPSPIGRIRPSMFSSSPILRASIRPNRPRRRVQVGVAACSSRGHHTRPGGSTRSTWIARLGSPSPGGGGMCPPSVPDPKNIRYGSAGDARCPGLSRAFRSRTPPESPPFGFGRWRCLPGSHGRWRSPGADRRGSEGSRRCG